MLTVLKYGSASPPDLEPLATLTENFQLFNARFGLNPEGTGRRRRMPVLQPCRGAATSRRCGRL